MKDQINYDSYYGYLKELQSEQMSISEASLYWKPKTDCVFVISKGVTYNPELLGINGVLAECHFYDHTQCRLRGFPRIVRYLVVAIHALTVDEVDPKSMLKAIRQIKEIKELFDKKSPLRFGQGG